MIIISTAFILSIIILATGFKKYLRHSQGYSDSIKISVIAAAKNESAIIERFVSSIENLDYPEENFELIIVDDNSTDNTYEITCRFIENRKNFRLIRAGVKTIDAKRGALMKGIENSLFPYIVITDADCVPSVNWLKTCSGEFEKGSEFIFGPSPFYKENNFINKLSCLENLKNHILSFSLTSLGMPYTASARNLGFSKDAFLRIGGYTGTQDTLSGDDDLLLREAVKNKLKISPFFDAMVYSFAKRNLKDYLNQKARHIQSSFHYLYKIRVVLGAWHLFNLIMLFSPALFFINFNFAWLFVLKIFADTLIILFIQKKFGYRFNIIEIIFYDILYEIFLIINFINALFRKVKWK